MGLAARSTPPSFLYPHERQCQCDPLLHHSQGERVAGDSVLPVLVAPQARFHSPLECWSARTLICYSSGSHGCLGVALSASFNANIVT